MIPIAILAISSNDERDFMTRLYLDYYALMRKHAYAILNTSQDVDDVVNDACIKLIDKIGILKTLDCYALTAYVVFTIRSVTIDLVRRRETRKKHGFFGKDEDMMDMLSDLDDGSDVAQLVIDSETAKDAVKRLSQLNERDRAILEYKYVLDMSDQEIAPLLGIKPQSVRQYLMRARRNAMKVLREGVEDDANF